MCALLKITDAIFELSSSGRNIDNYFAAVENSKRAVKLLSSYVRFDRSKIIVKFSYGAAQL